MALLLTGFLPWLFFSQTVLDSTACVTQEMALVKKAYFPRSILPLSALLSNFIHLCFAFIVLIALFALWGVQVKVSYWLVIPSTLLIAVFAYGLSAMLAAWSVFYSDVKFIVSNLLGLWFFLTPVLYPVASVLLKGQEAGNWLRALINEALPVVKMLYISDPVAIGILGYRSGLLYWGGSPIIVTPSPNVTEAEALAKQAAARGLYPLDHYIIIAAVVAIATAVVGQFIFSRLSRQFAERG
jgi:ABC-type polysaccharide/polyol phosphate export permease